MSKQHSIRACHRLNAVILYCGVSTKHASQFFSARVYNDNNDNKKSFKDYAYNCNEIVDD